MGVLQLLTLFEPVIAQVIEAVLAIVEKKSGITPPAVSTAELLSQVAAAPAVAASTVSVSLTPQKAS